MTAAVQVLDDVVPGEAIAAVYNAYARGTSLAEVLRRLADEVRELEPIGAGVLLVTADELEREASR